MRVALFDRNNDVLIMFKNKYDVSTYIKEFGDRPQFNYNKETKFGDRYNNRLKKLTISFTEIFISFILINLKAEITQLMLI
jgi:hypothetical protein